MIIANWRYSDDNGHAGAKRKATDHNKPTSRTRDSRVAVREITKECAGRVAASIIERRAVPFAGRALKSARHPDPSAAGANRRFTLRQTISF
jgi:hypothetical protein